MGGLLCRSIGALPADFVPRDIGGAAAVYLDNAEREGTALVAVGMTDYLNDLEAFLKIVAPQPVLPGHSMGGVLAQQLAAKGLARAIVLVSPAPHAGILPQRE